MAIATLISAILPYSWTTGSIAIIRLILYAIEGLLLGWPLKGAYARTSKIVFCSYSLCRRLYMESYKNALGIH